MRTLSKLGPYIVSALAVVGVLFLLGSLMSWSAGLNKPLTEEELTENMMGQAAPSPVAASPAATPPTQTMDPASPVVPAQPVTQPPAVDPAAPSEPLTQEDAPVTDTATDMVTAEGMQGDDYMIYLATGAGANATTTYAPRILEQKIAELTGTTQAAQIDLVAVYSSDGVMVASGRIPGGKWQ